MGAGGHMGTLSPDHLRLKGQANWKPRTFIVYGQLLACCLVRTHVKLAF